MCVSSASEAFRARRPVRVQTTASVRAERDAIAPVDVLGLRSASAAAARPCRSASRASRRAARFGQVWPGGLRASAVLRISLPRAETVVGGPYSIVMVFQGFGETWEGPLGVGTPYAHRRSERVDLATRADGAAPVSARNRSLVVRGPAPGPSGTPPGPERATRRRRMGSRSRRPGDGLSRSAEGSRFLTLRRRAYLARLVARSESPKDLPSDGSASFRVDRGVPPVLRGSVQSSGGVSASRSWSCRPWSWRQGLFAVRDEGGDCRSTQTSRGSSTADEALESSRGTPSPARLRRARRRARVAPRPRAGFRARRSRSRCDAAVLAAGRPSLKREGCPKRLERGGATCRHIPPLQRGFEVPTRARARGLSVLLRSFSGSARGTWAASSARPYREFGMSARPCRKFATSALLMTMVHL